MPRTLRSAILLALTTAAISGAANFLSKKAITVIQDPVTFTFLKNGLVALALLSLLLLLTRAREIRQLSGRQWFQLITIGIIGGGIPFVLFFSGLTSTSALTGSFIHKTLFLWVAMLAVPFLKEKLGWVQLAAVALLVGGNLALGLPKFHWNRGELMIFGATLFWAVENIIAKRTLQHLSSWLVGAARMTIGSVFLLAVVAWQGKFHLVTSLSAVQWYWTVVPSLLLLGYVLTWFTALKYAPATLVASLLVPATLITNVLTAIDQGKSLPTGQLASGGLFVLAIGLLVWSARRQPARSITVSEN